MKKPETFFIRTYGCQMNELDSEIICGTLEKRGLVATKNEDDADLVLYNTCSIRDLSERKVMGKIGLMARSKKREKIIGVTGCMATAKKDSLFKKLPHIDFVLGPNDIHQLNAVLDQALAKKNNPIAAKRHFYADPDYLSASRQDKLKASVSIIRGCNKCCTYCIVPYTRGREVSRSPESILEECKKLADNGYREITLLGQNVNSYGKDTPDTNCLFPELLYRIDKIPGIERVRFMTSHPIDISPDLMLAVRDLSTLCEFIHFPVQSGSNQILKRMHRIYTLEQYLEKVARFKELVPNVCLGTDIIVGFPGESDEDFEMTRKVMEEIEFSVAFIFAYSPRNGTPAMRWKDDIPQSVKEQRQQTLLQMQESINRKQRKKLIGSKMEVLFEKKSQKDLTMLSGKTRCWKSLVCQAPEDLIGSLQNVLIEDVRHQTLIGKLC